MQLLIINRSFSFAVSNIAEIDTDSSGRKTKLIIYS